MYLILLLSIPKVFGDFEQILYRQYEPAIEAQKRIDQLWQNGVVEHNYIVIRAALEERFYYLDVNRTKHYRWMFINEVLFKLNTSIKPETIGIKLLFTKKIKGNIDVEYIKAAVKWGGQYMFLVFYHRTSDGYFPLIYAKLSSRRPKVTSRLDKSFAIYTMDRMMIEEDVFDKKFVYTTCTNRSITDRKYLMAQSFSKQSFQIEDSMHYYGTRYEIERCYGVIACSNPYPNRFVQIKMKAFDGKKHLFEVDWNTGKIVKGLELSCGWVKNVKQQVWMGKASGA